MINNPTSIKVKKVAVIGAGPSGLVSIKCLIKDGFDVVCFDESSDIGGLWNYSAGGGDKPYQPYSDEEKRPIKAVYKHLKTNTASCTTAFSDFLGEGFTLGTATFSHEQYLTYLEQYASHFGLKPHIKLNSWVYRVIKEGSKWRVYYQTLNYRDSKSILFDFVLIATGIFNYPYIPEIKGQETFKGHIIHTAQVRDEEALFEGKTAYIIGGSNSSLEITSEALKNGVKKVYGNVAHLPKTKNYYMMNRLVTDEDGNERPWDVINRRELYFERQNDHMKLFNSWFMQLHQCNDNKIPVLFADGFALSDKDTIKSNLETKRYEIVAGIKEIKDGSLVLEDERCLEGVDIVISGTGYVVKYPFISHLWSDEQQNQCNLYKNMIPVEESMDGLAFVFTRHTYAPLFIMAEMQARWISKKIFTREYDVNGLIFSAEERESMKAKVDEQIAEESKIFFRHIPCMYTYADALAKELGCSPPKYNDIVDTDPELAIALFHGPMNGTQYRLNGCDIWDGARDHLVKIAKDVLGEKFNELLNSIKK